MAAPAIDAPAPHTAEPEVPLLGVFAALIVVAVVVIGVMIAVPTTLTLVLAIGTVIGFAVAVTALLSRMIDG
jgi:hypothetical protein